MQYTSGEGRGDGGTPVHYFRQRRRRFTMTPSRELTNSPVPRRGLTRVKCLPLPPPLALASDTLARAKGITGCEH